MSVRMLHSRTPAGRWARSWAFTLPELMVAMAVFSFALAGLLSVHLMGLKVFEVTKTKLGANQEARESLAMIVADVRSAKTVQVGEGDETSFAETGLGELQQGNALRIFLSTNTNSFIQYYRDDEKRLLRITSSNHSPKVVARSISNSLVFTSEDCQGNILTNNQNNRVIGLLLQFYQVQYPVVPIGPGNQFDFYQLRTRVTRRTLE